MLRPLRAAQVVILGVILAGCSTAGASPSLWQPSPAASAAGDAEPTVTAAPSVAPATPSPTVMPSPKASPKQTAAPVPPKPTGVTFKVLRRVETETGYRETYQVTWKTPRSKGVEVRVYGLTKCLAEPSSPPPGNSGPCLVEHTVLPRSFMALAATTPSATGEIRWTAPFAYECAGPPVGPDGLDYQAIVISAYNAAGHSTFAIAYEGAWQRPAPGEVIC